MQETKDYSKNGLMKKTVSEYMSAVPDGKISKLNLEYVRGIKEYMADAEDLRKELDIFLELMKKEDEREYKLNVCMIRNVCNIIQSIGGQIGFAYALKNQLMKHGIHDKVTKESIVHTINRLNERLNYIRSEIMTTYIEITPFDPYVKFLAKNGVSLSEDMHVQNDLTLDVYVDTENYIPSKEISDYVNRILQFAQESGDTDYERKREEYRNANVAHLDKIAAERQERQNELRKDEALKNQKTLNTYCKRVETAIISGNVTNFLKKQVFNLMINRISKLQSGATYRIIGVIPSKGPGKGTVHFIKDENGHQVNSITSAKIFSDLEEVNRAIDAVEMADPYAVVAFIQVEKEITICKDEQS